MAPLNASTRNALPRSLFALATQRAYPIDTPARARDALGRATQHATPSQQQTIRRKVHERYPAIKINPK